MTCLLPVLTLYDRFHLFRVHLPQSYVHQGAYDDPHHIVKKSISDDFKMQGTGVGILRIPLGAVNGPDCGLRNVTSCRHKASEILFADQVLCCTLHGIQLKRFFNLITVISLQDVGLGGVAYLIDVLFAEGIKAGMKLHIHFPCLSYSHISYRIRAFPRQQMVCRNGDPVCGNAKLSLKAGPLPIGMDACIRAACAMQCDLLFAEQGKYPLQFALHRALAGLPLPSGEVSTVVFNCQQNVFHNCGHYTTRPTTGTDLVAVFTSAGSVPMVAFEATGSDPMAAFETMGSDPVVGFVETMF